MSERQKNEIVRLFTLIFIVCSSLFVFHTEILYALEKDESIFIQKVSKSYTKKYCNAIGFGLSKESAMKFSLEENRQVFQKRKEFNNINKDLLAEKIAISVVEKCGYPINLSGEKGIQEFKNYYLSKENDLSRKDRE